MCAIIGWSGKMPVGFLTQLFIAAEHRGRQSAGLAFVQENQVKVIKQAVPATFFVKHNSEHVKEARLATLGLGHTRRASQNMPVNDANAHPFIYQNYVFAHNGSIKNWKELTEQRLLEIDNQEVDETTNLRKLYFRNITTDSMILGPFLEELNFTDIEGSLGLIWFDNGKLYCFRSKKELTAAKIIWQTETSDENNELTVIASTWKIIEEALDCLKNIKYDAEEVILDENTLYGVHPSEIKNEGAVHVNKKNFIDKFTSKEDSTCA